jgi:hypothetical protein
LRRHRPTRSNRSNGAANKENEVASFPHVTRFANSFRAPQCGKCGDDTSLKNDVWSSADGKDWKQETASAPWSPRAYHAAVVHDGKLWVIAGGNYVPNYRASSDVWSSPDGVSWQQVTDRAPWNPWIWFSAVVHRDRMWVLGGWSNNPARNWGDVWHSRDGRQWTQLRSNVIWKRRHEHSAYVFRDKIWIAGGHAQPLNSEVWSLEIPKDWSED